MLWASPSAVVEAGGSLEGAGRFMSLARRRIPGLSHTTVRTQFVTQPLCTLGGVGQTPARTSGAGSLLGSAEHAHPPQTSGLDAEVRRDLIERVGPLAERFVAAGHRFFLVGGLVRDLLLGHGIDNDIDITTDALPNRIAELTAQWAHVIWDQGKAFGTIGARRGDTTVEITTHRAESYDRDSRKPHVRFCDDIVIDLSRRDFTVNAMAIELPGWSLLDPFGGRMDLASGVLRTPSEPVGLFSDDPLRMLRAARFSARLDLEPTPDLIAAVHSTRPRLDIVSTERIAAELTKLLELPRPAAGVAFLDHTGLLGDLLPPWNAETDNACSAARLEVPTAALDAVEAEVGLRWAVLLGPVCPTADRAAACLAALRIPKHTVTRVAAILRAVAALEDAGGAIPTPSARRLVVGHADTIEAAASALAAWGRPLRSAAVAALREIETTEGAALRTLPVDGNRVMALLDCSGPMVGEALSWLTEQQIRRGPLDEATACGLLTDWVSRRDCEKLPLA